jgi:hypothetical protein
VLVESVYYEDQSVSRQLCISHLMENLFCLSHQLSSVTEIKGCFMICGEYFVTRWQKYAGVVGPQKAVQKNALFYKVYNVKYSV